MDDDDDNDDDDDDYDADDHYIERVCLVKHDFAIGTPLPPLSHLSCLAF